VGARGFPMGPVVVGGVLLVDDGVIVNIPLL
jgi:hypothetical protein